MYRLMAIKVPNFS